MSDIAFRPTVRYGRSLSAVESLKHHWGGHEEPYESIGSGTDL
jgi:hypothetical protein